MELVKRANQMRGLMAQLFEVTSILTHMINAFDLGWSSTRLTDRPTDWPTDRLAGFFAPSKPVQPTPPLCTAS